MTAVPDPAYVPADGNAIGARAGKARAPVRGDPGRAARVIADAERTAQSITDEDAKPFALAAVAEALAGTDPGRAERIAQSITNASALANLAKVLAATDPARAERVARSETHEYSKAESLRDLAEVLAGTDPGRAERIARSITDEYLKASALTNLARAAVQHAADDPEAVEPGRGR